MMLNKLYIGIDTSCYMTSLAAVACDKVFQYKKSIIVKAGECGLRQSEALFQHLKNFPDLFNDLKRDVDFSKFDDICISVSTKPRNVENSYMPVFCAGESFAKVIADSLNARLFKTSHQDGHIMAVICSGNKMEILNKPFISVHLSGGTTEILLCNLNENKFSCEIVGGTKDLPCGQFIDRIGVLTGKSFPAGKYVDFDAVNYNYKTKSRKICMENGFLNFSGEETHIRRLYNDKKISDKEASYMTMKYISDSMKSAILFCKEKYGVNYVLMAGGVSSSEFLRKELSDISGIIFSKPEFSGDNAYGVCNMGKFFDN